MESSRISPTPTQAAWLIVNLAWVHAVVPRMLTWGLEAFRDPQSGTAFRFFVALLDILGIPFVAVLGFGVASWHVAAWLAARVH